MTSVMQKFHCAIPVEDRLWPRLVEESGGCWRWTGSTISGGYGRIRVDGVQRSAHVVAYELVVGLVPPGLILDHLCRNRACCNPAHLEPVTFRENVLRGQGTGARYARRTHCAAGHPLEGTNLVLREDGGRRCRICRNRTGRVARRARRAAARRLTA